MGNQHSAPPPPPEPSMEMPPMQDVAAACLSVILLLNVAKGYLTSSSLGSMAASPLFPVIVGALSGLNLFTLVLTAPLVLAYCTAAVVAKGRLGWLFVALCNAAGTVAGSYAMIVFMEGGTGGSVAYIKESFPAAFASQWWARTEFVVDAYGAAGAVAISSLPVILHPLIAICKLADMSTASLLYCIMLGRTIKYIIMGQVARQAPSALKYFGASADTIAKVKKSA